MTNYFTSLRLPSHEPLNIYLIKLAKFIFFAFNEGDSFIDDLDGAEGNKELCQGIKVRFLEYLFYKDLLIHGNCSMDDEHQLPLALENGISSICPFEGTELAQLFHLFDISVDNKTLIKDIGQLWNEILIQFPGEIPSDIGKIMKSARLFNKQLTKLGQSKVINGLFNQANLTLYS